MNEILITGVTGFIGKHLLRRLEGQKNIRIRALVHKKPDTGLLNKDNISVIEGDLTRRQTLDRFCAKGATLVNLAYLGGRSRQDNLAAVNNLLDACAKAGIKRFIHCSSAAVFGRLPADIVSENTACNPANEYEAAKLQIEKTILGCAGGAFETVILRPTAVFGPGGKNLLKLAGDLRSGNKAANYLKSCLFNTRKMNLVSVYNVVSAIELFINTEEKISRDIYIISDDDDRRNNYRYIEQYLMKALSLNDYPIPVIPFPSFLLKLLLKLMGKTMFDPARVYSSRKLSNFGFKKNISFEDGLADFSKWYKTAL
ncbi:MAG: NAD-dependent epimerase/dehydratase family protein [Candidatus Omnitrophica bacterium]|nr:NAD-dependent epimerase/dehydratase family protein [Candidatus Omnitrophota bacterium]